MKSQNLTSTDVREILSIKSDEAVTQDSFCERMLCLGKVHEKTNLLNEHLSSLSYSEQKKHYEKNFIEVLENVFVKLNNFSQTSLDLAIELYKLKQITNSTYDDISRQMNVAYNKKISKSYLSKLINSGRVLTDFPELKAIQDIEKLALLSSLSGNELEKYLKSKGEKSFIRDLGLNEASRSRLKSAIDEIKIENGYESKRAKKEKEELENPLTAIIDSSQPGRFDKIIKNLESIAPSIQHKTNAYEKLLACIEILKDE